MSAKQSLLTPNGTRWVYDVERLNGGIWVTYDAHITLPLARHVVETTMDVLRLRITARLSDGRKLVLP